MPDPTQSQPPHCPKCGSAVPDNAPGKVCTACLVTSILGDPCPEIPAGPTKPPSRIPGFELLEKIGEGGFGVIYAAEQLQPVQRKVAIKILKPGSTGSEPLARFEAERQALALMDHPGIAHVYDAGETRDGQPYFVMELIDGDPITTHCTREKLDLDTRLQLFIHTCHAIGHAHHRGVIHRDLKPSNILVQSTGSEPTTKIIDFGIAKATESLLTDLTLLTRDNQVIGTPSYMSPEQAAGSSIVDTRSDIYSLGVLLYELVTGTPPFRDQDLKDLPWDEALKKIRTESPPRPSTRIRSVGPGPSHTHKHGDLDWVVMRAIEKDPQRRYQTAGDLAADITRFQNNEAIEARPPGTAYRLRKFVSKHRLPVAAALAVATALLAGTLVSLSLYLQAGEHAEQAARSDLRGRQQFSRADFTHASQVVDEHPAIAVTHLARALRSDPTNDAATSLLTNTLAYNDWPSRSFPPFDHGSLIRSLDFTPDGSLFLVTGDNETLEAIDPTSGNVVHSIDLGGAGSSITPNPAGTHAAV
ncbi:MAG: protein kinase, partial [Verrucomicrobiales bacterium]|nr:protein kinase [Verrucomicrobiales bacterium]